MEVEILGDISRAETISIGRAIRELDRLEGVHGPGRSRKRKGTAMVRLPDGTVSGGDTLVRSTRYRTRGFQGEAHSLGQAMKISASESECVICVKNEDYRVSLVIRKVYKVVPDPESRRRGLIRVIDESGEDYLFPENLFVQVQVPKGAERVLARTTERPV